MERKRVCILSVKSDTMTYALHGGPSGVIRKIFCSRWNFKSCLGSDQGRLCSWRTKLLVPQSHFVCIIHSPVLVDRSTSSASPDGCLKAAMRIALLGRRLKHYSQLKPNHFVNVDTSFPSFRLAEIFAPHSKLWVSRFACTVHSVGSEIVCHCSVTSPPQNPLWTGRQLKKDMFIWFYVSRRPRIL